MLSNLYKYKNFQTNNGTHFDKFFSCQMKSNFCVMKKNIFTILLSVLLSGLVAYGVGKSTNETVSPDAGTASNT